MEAEEDEKDGVNEPDDVHDDNSEPDNAYEDSVEPEEDARRGNFRHIAMQCAPAVGGQPPCPYYQHISNPRCLLDPGRTARPCGCFFLKLCHDLWCTHLAPILRAVLSRIHTYSS